MKKKGKSTKNNKMLVAVILAVITLGIIALILIILIFEEFMGTPIF